MQPAGFLSLTVKSSLRGKVRHSAVWFSKVWFGGVGLYLVALGFLNLAVGFELAHRRKKGNVKKDER